MISASVAPFWTGLGPTDDPEGAAAVMVSLSGPLFRDAPVGGAEEGAPAEFGDRGAFATSVIVWAPSFELFFTKTGAAGMERFGIGAGAGREARATTGADVGARAATGAEDGAMLSLGARGGNWALAALGAGACAATAFALARSTP